MKTFLKVSKLFLHQKKKRKIEDTVPIPNQGTDSGNKETDNEYDRNQGNYENDKICYNG